MAKAAVPKKLRVYEVAKDLGMSSEAVLQIVRRLGVEVEKLELGEATTEKLISAGIETVQELVATPLDKLVEIPGVGEKTAEKLLAVAQEYLAAHPPEPAELPAPELEFTPEMESNGGPATERVDETELEAPAATEGGEHRA